MDPGTVPFWRAFMRHLFFGDLGGVLSASALRLSKILFLYLSTYESFFKTLQRGCILPRARVQSSKARSELGCRCPSFTALVPRPMSGGGRRRFVDFGHVLAGGLLVVILSQRVDLCVHLASSTLEHVLRDEHGLVLVFDHLRRF